MTHDSIKVLGARENNLKGINISIPYGKHTVITGVSGSGKTSLAYNVIYAVGKKRLMECMEESDRRFSTQLKQPDVNYIQGLTPMISIRQQKANRNPRATVGTTTEISSYVRNLYVMLSTAVCPICRREYALSTSVQIMNKIKSFPENTIVEVLFPVYKTRFETYDDFFAELQSKGYGKVYIDGVQRNLRDWIEIKEEPKLIMVYAGYITAKAEMNTSDSKLLQHAASSGEGLVQLKISGEDESINNHGFYDNCACPQHCFFALDILPSYFNINDLRSSCKECLGTGISKEANPEALFRDKSRSLQKGPFHSTIYNVNQPFWYMVMYSMAKHYDFSFTEPFENLPEFAQNLILYGTNGKTFPLLRPDGYVKKMPGYTPREGELVDFEGFATRMLRFFEDWQKAEFTQANELMFNRYMTETTCPSCNGGGLRPQRTFFRLASLSYNEMEQLEIRRLKDVLFAISAEYEASHAVTQIINELKRRIEDLEQIGLAYLTLNRRIDTLSGGEYQRVRIAGQLGSGLTGLTYILDEPTAGLHGADTEKISAVIRRFLEQGNTVITIEHDLDIIRQADYIIEMGPGSGKSGGYVIADGTVQDIMRNRQSVMARFLNQEKLGLPHVHSEACKSANSNSTLEILGARANNLKNIDASIPLNRFICLTGVSGSGKSSLMVEILFKAVRKRLNNASVIPGDHDEINGIESIKNVYCIDQRPINKTKTSIPASYIQIMDKIREVFAASRDAKKLGIAEAAYFSYNTKGGCPGCSGMGNTQTHIHYLGDVKIVCEQCKGKRYLDEVLDVKYKGKNIAEVLEMPFDEALEYFEDHTYIRNKIEYVCALGLGYLPLGQQVNTLSGGEGQRLRLAKELGKNRGKKHMLYILDEPTTGLHAQDVEKVISCIRSIIDKENTVIVIEHNPYLIRCADYIIDMGPGAGEDGGRIIAQGSLTDIINNSNSITGKYLKR